MTIFGMLWRFSYRFLSARVWPGVGVIVTLVTLVLNLEVIKGILAGLDGGWAQVKIVGTYVKTAGD